MELKDELGIANAKLAYQDDEATLPVGLDIDEEPGLFRRDVRRRADWFADGQHDARSVDEPAAMLARPTTRLSVTRMRRTVMFGPP
jgi:hypothetical protein